MTSSGGKLIITIHILPNISRSEGNQTMDLGKLIEYNMGNIFLVKPCTKCVEKISPRPKTEIEHTSRSTVRNFIAFFLFA